MESLPLTTNKVRMQTPEYHSFNIATYTSFEQVKTIDENFYHADFTYNSNNQRCKMVVKHSGNTQLTRWYVGSRYIKETEGSTTKEYTWIGDDAYTAPVVAVKQGSNIQYLYLLRDYLGNIALVIDASYNVTAEFSYDACSVKTCLFVSSSETKSLVEQIPISEAVREGRRRNASNWSYTLTNEPDLLAGRGFTGHEYLPWFKLYNMNGRLYDPLVGRFLSPDNYVQMADYTQSFNRYSYALNNPLIFTDPSGEFWGWFAAMAGNYLFGVADNWINKGMPLGQAFAATPATISGNYHFNNSRSNSQVSAQQMPGILVTRQQTIANNLAGFSGLTEDASMFPELTMPDMELGGIELLANPQYNQTPARINFNGSGDEVLTGLTNWIDYLHTGHFSLKKTCYGKYYSIDDVFYNLPGASMGGYGTAGDIKGKWYRTSSNNIFSIGIHRLPNNSMKGGSTFLKGMRYGVATNGPNKTYFWLFIHNGTRSGTSYNKVFQLQFYGEDFYAPIKNSIINKIPTN